VSSDVVGRCRNTMTILALVMLLLIHVLNDMMPTVGRLSIAHHCDMFRIL